MVLAISDDGVNLGDELLRYEDFPAYLKSHRRRYPTTSSLEHRGDDLALYLDNQDWPAVLRFIVDVSNWRDNAGSRVLGEVRKGLQPSFLVNQFASAIDAMFEMWESTSTSTLMEVLTFAVSEINRIPGLTTPYSSRILRFLRPDICAVFDSVMSGCTGLACNEDNFAAYSIDCLKVESNLFSAGVTNPYHYLGKWDAADVDLALVAFYLGWNDSGL